VVTRGFTRRSPSTDKPDRIPPGQHVVGDFPVLTAVRHPRVSLDDWSFTLKIVPVP
jgi:hypothetical protein